MSAGFEHRALVREVTPSAEGREDCLRSGDPWVRLRVRKSRGHVGCCNCSPNRHATAHWHSDPEHPVLRSFEPDENWWWGYAEDLALEFPDAPPSPSHS